MDLQSILAAIDSLSMEQSRQLRSKLDDHCEKIRASLTAALPELLQEKYGDWDKTSNLVWNRECEFWMFEGVGMELTEDQIDEYRRKAMVMLEPVIAAWEPLGVEFDVVTHLKCNNGLIMAYFKA
ncbi:MAG: hypothetical protein WCV85_03835 [Patescibacteria group bacterium]|jgi:hypothetical protein